MPFRKVGEELVGFVEPKPSNELLKAILAKAATQGFSRAELGRLNPADDRVFDLRPFK